MNRRTRFMLTGVMLLGLAISGDPVGAESRLAQRSNANIEVLVDGTGPLVFMIPSLGRGAEDFEQLSQAVVAAGYRVARVQPRGVGRSAGETEALSMRDFADDAAAGIEAAGGGPAVVLGHAGGQRVARMVAAAHPDLVRAVIMLAAGGKAPALPAAAAALSAVFNEALPDAEHLQAVRVAFFAPGNDPTVWRGGWYPATMKMQLRAANSAASVDDWWSAGRIVPILVIQGLQDQIAPPENGRILKAEAPDRVELVELDGAGHALLPEKPADIARTITGFLGRVTRNVAGSR
jgi:pimeloyl-ACP methyl ester carboxylesterase